jgi:hypothetical protein
MRGPWTRRVWAVSSVLTLLVLVGVVPARAGSAAPGCQVDRRTVVHSGGRALSRKGRFEPCLVDTGMTTAESGLAVDRSGSLIRSATTDPLGVAVSSDAGATWVRRPLPEGAPAEIADGYLDPVTNRYFYSGAGAGAVYSTDDLGRTWHEASFESATPFFGDWNRVFSGRPVVARASGYPTNVYYCNWSVPLGVASPTRCFKSTDGGQHFVQAGPDFNPAPCADATYTPGSAHGRGIVDPRDGSIYLTIQMCDELSVAVSRDEGATWSRRVVPGARSGGIRSVLDQVADPAWRDQNLGGRTNPVGSKLATSQFSDSIAMDARGRLYVVWIDVPSYLPRLATSADGGRTWTAPVAITPPGVAEAVLPSLAVTPGGRLGISYYGTTDAGKTWTGYLAIADDAAVPAPVFETATVSRPGAPLMDEPCCWAGGAQEYTAARWGPDGSLWGAFAGSTPSGDAEGWVGRLVRR